MLTMLGYESNKEFCSLDFKCAVILCYLLSLLSVSSSVTPSNGEIHSCDSGLSDQSTPLLCLPVLKDITYCFQYRHTMSIFCCGLCAAKAGEFGWRPIGSTPTTVAQTTTSTTTTIKPITTATTISTTKPMTTRTTTAPAIRTSIRTPAPKTTRRLLPTAIETTITATPPTNFSRSSISITWSTPRSTFSKSITESLFSSTLLMTTQPVTSITGSKSAFTTTIPTVTPTTISTSNAAATSTRAINRTSPLRTIRTTSSSALLTTETKMTMTRSSNSASTTTTLAMSSAWQTDLITINGVKCRCSESDYAIDIAVCAVVKHENCMELSLSYHCCYKCVEELLRQRECTAHCNDDPGHISGGIFNRNITYKENKTAVYRCDNWFYELIESERPVTCQFHPWKGGVWIGELPKCQQNRFKITTLAGGTAAALLTLAIVVLSITLIHKKKKKKLKKYQMNVQRSSSQPSSNDHSSMAECNDSDSCYYSRINEENMDTHSYDYPTVSNNSTGVYVTEVAVVTLQPKPT